MSPLIIPSLIVVTLKVFIFIFFGRAIRKSHYFLFLSFASLLLLNIAEISIFWHVNSPDSIAAIISVRLYYSFALLSSASFVAVAVYTLTQKDGLPTIIMLLSLLMACAVAATPYWVTSAENIGYSLTAVRGIWYPSLLGTLVFLLVSFAVIAVYSFLRSKNTDVQRKSLVLLVGILPVVSGGLMAILFLVLNIKINATVIISVATTLMIWILAYAESRYGLFKLHYWLQALRPNSYRKELNQLLDDTALKLFYQEEFDQKNLINDIDALIVKEAHRINKNSVRTAKLLNISKATLFRKLSRS